MDEKPSTSHQKENLKKSQSSSRENASLRMSSQLTLLKHALNSDKVQLWNPPYTLENGKQGEISQVGLFVNGRGGRLYIIVFIMLLIFSLYITGCERLGNFLRLISLIIRADCLYSLIFFL